MEELTQQIVGQCFVTMKYCIKLVLSRRSVFKFVRSLLENQIENIRQTRGSNCVIVYQALVELLGTYWRDHRNLKRDNLVADAQRVSKDLYIKQEQERREIEERIAECTHHIDTFRISYQGLIDDLHQSEVTSKAAEDIIASARVQKELDDHSTKLETFLAQLSSKTLLSNKKLRPRLWLRLNKSDFLFPLFFFFCSLTFHLIE